MEKLIERLKEKYGCNEPIFTVEILSAWSEYSRPRVFQLLKGATAEGLLVRFAMGIYYIPTMTFLGKPSSLDPQKVIEKQYIESGGEVYGYYSGMTLLNGALLWTAGKENDLKKAFSSDPLTECNYYEGGKYSLINNSNESQVTDFYSIGGDKKTIKLKGGQTLWI
jgi:hypothetical protein